MGAEAPVPGCFQVVKPEYIQRELGKILWSKKESPPCLENPLDRRLVERIVACHIAGLRFEP